MRKHPPPGREMEHRRFLREQDPPQQHGQVRSCSHPCHFFFFLISHDSAADFTSSSYAFGIALGDDKTVSCSAVGDTGFSGATYLGFIYDGACADDDSWSWTFSNGYNNGTASPAYFTLTQGSLTAHHNISADEITVGLNTEPNPFDNDVYYSGPKDFFVSNLD
ncbi:hypothetical protein F4778DRAFT_727515 [Xylariomycetidae sp. FL2044]|nr:hypothetical protein F4778DRAFT_727515 [Xylariomycetidae sp. FL2044]